VLLLPILEKQYDHILIDLDRTLWDFESNAIEALTEILTENNLLGVNIPNIKSFYSHYQTINDYYWGLYRLAKIDQKSLRIARFKETLGYFNVEDDFIIKKISKAYVDISPTKTNLMPNAIEALDYLYGKYNLHIITDGFSEVQFIKLKHSALENYFNSITTPDQAGVKKPNIEIFKYALKSARAVNYQCIMIGDDLAVDIEGAKNVGIDQVYYNPLGKIHTQTSTYEINDLIELKTIL